jgi:hypothetical protein
MPSRVPYDPIDSDSKYLSPMDSRGVQLPPSIYFGGCSWGAAFFVGVYKAMNEVSTNSVIV